MLPSRWSPYVQLSVFAYSLIALLHLDIIAAAVCHLQTSADQKLGQRAVLSPRVQAVELQMLFASMQGHQALQLLQPRWLQWQLLGSLKAQRQPCLLCHRHPEAALAAETAKGAPIYCCCSLL